MERPESALKQRNRQLEAVFRITSALYARAKEGLRAPALHVRAKLVTDWQGQRPIR